MKKLLKMMATPILVLLLTTTIFANSPDILINNEKLSVSAVSQEGRVLVPLRAIFESLGAKVDYDNGKITGTQGDKVIILTVNDKEAFVNANRVALDVPAKVIKGSTLVPVRFIGESLGAEVLWHNNTVVINLTGTVTMPTKPTKQTHKVLRVVDGDTIIVNYNGEEERLRLIGIDTPESVHPTKSKNVEEGKIASNYAKGMLEGKHVVIEFDVQQRDHYGRLLGYVYLGDKMFNKALLEQGYAQLATYPPNVKYVDDFKRLQTVARENKMGFWDNGFVTTPVESTEANKPIISTNPTSRKAEGSAPLPTGSYPR